MPSTDYPGQGFNAITSDSDLDDSELGNESFNLIDFQNDLDDSELGNESFNLIDFQNDLDDSESGFARDNIQHESDDPGGTGGGGGITTYYGMRAIDPDCPTLTYVAWVVTGSPDATGAQYAGSRCGASPLTDITITAKWQI
jgi:hypothetical protein